MQSDDLSERLARWETENIPYYKILCDREGDRRALAEALVEEGTEVSPLPRSGREVIALIEEGVAEVTVVSGNGDAAAGVARSLARAGCAVSLLRVPPDLGSLADLWRDLGADSDALTVLLRAMPFHLFSPMPTAPPAPAPQVVTPGPQLIDLDDFLAAGPGKYEWVVEDLILRKGITILYGDRKSLKSLLALQLAIDVARGTPWLGMFATAQGGVVLIDRESPREPFYERLVQLVKGNGVTARLPIKLYKPRWDGPFNLMTDAEFLPLKSAMAVAQPSLIIIDSLRRIHRQVEDSSTEMSLVMGRLMDLADSTRAAVVVIHHTPKDGTTPRGSGDIIAAADSGLLVSKINLPANAPPHAKAEVLIDHTDSRWTEELDSFQAGLVQQAGGLRMEFSSWAAQATGTKHAVACLEIERLLKATDMCQEDLLTALQAKGLSRSTGRRAIDDLKKQGKVTELQRQGTKIPLRWAGP